MLVAKPNAVKKNYDKLRKACGLPAVPKNIGKQEKLK
jgi:hypothetical protein